jgi:hypothetical protein
MNHYTENYLSSIYAVKPQANFRLGANLQRIPLEKGAPKPQD